MGCIYDIMIIYLADEATIVDNRRDDNIACFIVIA